VLLAHNAGGNCAIGALIDGQHNLSDDDTCGDLGLNSLSDVDAGLEPLDASWTLPTYSLVAGSPAIDAGLAIRGETNEFYDQRGTLRPQDGDADGVAVWDIGSIEVPGPDPEPSPPGGLPNTAVRPRTPTNASPGAPVAIVLFGALVLATGLRQRTARRIVR
jgi:hypothetical protein